MTTQLCACCKETFAVHKLRLHLRRGESSHYLCPVCGDSDHVYPCKDGKIVEAEVVSTSEPRPLEVIGSDMALPPDIVYMTTIEQETIREVKEDQRLEDEKQKRFDVQPGESRACPPIEPGDIVIPDLSGGFEAMRRQAIDRAIRISVPFTRDQLEALIPAIDTAVSQYTESACHHPQDSAGWKKLSDTNLSLLMTKRKLKGALATFGIDDPPKT